MSLTDLVRPAFSQMLESMSGWLRKAEDKSDAVLSLRLAPDMFPLSAQVRFACFQAQEPIYRLRGLPLPQALEEVRREGVAAGDRPGTLIEAQTRIAEARDVLAALESTALDAERERLITLELPDRMTFDMTGEQYIRDWSIPQFYFHLNTAYAILRANGVDLGKRDYVPHMFAYLRRGSTPEG